MKKFWILILTVWCAGMALADEDDRCWFVDKNWMYEQGSALSSEYLQGHAPDFSGKLERILPWIVRIEARHSFIEGGYSSNHGTGIILKGGKVLTANHVLIENVKGAEVEVVLTLMDGRIFSASIEEQGERDWARLQMDIPDGQEDLLASPIALEVASPGETVVFIGYPARLGLDAQGHVKSFRKGNREQGVPADKLLPMLVVAAADDLEAMTLKPLAGFPPVGGMSGGPLFNLNGQLVGVQHSVSTTTDNATGGVLYYKIEATPSSATCPSGIAEFSIDTDRSSNE